MAKQSFKKQVIQQIADKQVQQVMAQKREQEMAQLQADYNAWKTQQDGIAQLQAEYDAWKAEQPIQQATVNEVKTVEKPRDIYLDRPGDKYDKKKAAEAISKRQAFLEDRRKKQKEQLPSLINYEDYFRQQQEEGMLASKKGAPKKETPGNSKLGYNYRGEEKDQVDYSNNKRGGAKWDKSVNDTLNMLNSDEVRALNTMSSVRKAQQQSKEDEIKTKLDNIPDDILNDYAERRGISVDEARAEIEKNLQNSNATIAPTDESKINQELSESAHNKAAEELRRANQKKYTPYEAWGLATGKAVSDVVNGPVYLAGKITGNDWDLYSDAQRESYAQSKEQHPTASNLGTMTGMAMAGYNAGGGAAGRELAAQGMPSVTEAYASNGIGGALKTLAANSGKELLRTDLATDIIPTLANDIAEGKSAKETAWNTISNLGINFGLNVAGDIPGLVSTVKQTNAERANALAKGLNNEANIFTKNSLDNVNTSVYDEGVKNVDANNGGMNYGTDINGTGNPENIRMGESDPILPENSGQSKGTRAFGRRDSSISGGAVVNPQVRQIMSEAGVNDVKLRDYSNNYKAYSDALSEARKANSHGAFVDPQSVEELQQYNAKAYMSDNGGCGVAVKDNGNIVGVFKNTSKYENAIEAAGAASDELLTARLNGGDRLDCYCVTTADKNLVNMYSPAGFEPTHKVRYERGINPEMDAWCDNDIKKWVESGHKEEDYVYPDIVFMKVRDGESVEDTLRLLKEDKIPTYDELLAQMPYTEARNGVSAYEVAEMERDALIKEQPKQGAFFDGETFNAENINKNSINNNLSIQEVNRNGGKKGYYVTEELPDGTIKNVENGKVYKTREEAEEALKVMAEDTGIPKGTPEPESAKTTIEIPDTPENAPTEPKPTNTTEELWDELKKGENGGQPTTPPTNTPEVNEQGQKLSKLHSTLQNTETLTDAEKKAYADKNGFWYDPDVERDLAANTQKEIESIGLDAMYERYMGNDLSGKVLNGQDTHNLFTTSYDYNRMAQEALKEGNEAAAKLYEAKARNIMLFARETGTDYGQFNAAIAYYARTPQKYIDKAYDLLGKQIKDFKGNNPKLSGDIDRIAKGLSEQLKDVDVDGIMSGSDEVAKQTLRQQVLDGLEDMLKKAGPQAKNKFSNLSTSELDDLITSKYERDLAKTLDMFAMGSFGIKPETVDKVMDIFAEAEKYNLGSKKHYNLEKEAYDLLANDLMDGKGKSFGEKFDTWRYFAMLSNPLTHLKNVTGNITNGGLTGIKNNLAAAIEASADRVAKAKGREGINGGRTKAALNLLTNEADKALVEGAGKDFEDYSFRAFKEGGSKWLNIGRELENAGDVYSNKNLAGKSLNTLTGGNTKLLDAEDIMAGKAKYQTSLAGFLKANGADASIFTKTDDASKELLEQAREYALHQASEATFHQTNELAQSISNWINEGKHSSDTGRKLVARGLDFMVPFIKTPGNILRACWEYSPFEFITVAKETKAWRNGAISTAKYIDDISKGVTGTVGMGIGALLAASGILKVSSGDDTEDTFNKKRGITTPSIKIGNASFRLSELVPGAMPIIIGATVFETIKNSKKSADAAADTFFNGLSAIGDTVTDMTMLSGIASTLNDIRYSKNDSEMWGQLVLGVATNATGQMLPTLGRKIEQTVDDTARSTYSGQDSKLLRTLDSSAKYWKTKLPVLQEAGELMEKSNNQHIAKLGDYLTNEPQINAWGEEIKNADYGLGKINKGLGYLGRGIHNTVDVFDTQVDSSNNLDKELKKIASGIKDQETKDNVLKYGLQPSTSDATVEGQRMSEKQWTEYQKGLGTTKSDLLQSFMKTDSYGNLKPEDQSAMLDSMASFSKAYNQNAIMGKELSDENQKLAALYKNGETDKVVNYLMTKAALKEANIDGSSTEAKKAKEAALKGDTEKTKEVIEQASQANDLYAKYNLTDDENAGTVLSKAGEDGLKYYSEFKKKGLPDYRAALVYNSATTEITDKSKLPTPDEFATTYKSIDSLIKPNGHVDQDEFLTWLNKGDHSDEDAAYLATLYGDWSSVPKKTTRGKNKGKWRFD